MGESRLSWAERRVSWTREEASHAVVALATSVERTCHRCFPPSAGYTTELTHLRGLVDGVRVSVRRGSFHAVVSTHYFLDERPNADGWAIRMVAAARRRPPTMSASARFNRRLAIGLALSGVVAVLIAAFSASGLWGYFRLSLIMSFLIMMTPALAWLGAVNADTNPALPSPWPALPPAGDEDFDDFERWRQTLDEMDAEQALLGDPRGTPFRR